MANKAKRFPTPPEMSEQPGPGAYSIQKKSDWIKEVGRIGPASAPAGTGSKDGTSTKGSVRFLLNFYPKHFPLCPLFMT